ncbi:MAG: hypothetical protein HC781_08400 [Leptolyngbyaceae cyanobacterium CSU_1_4]|nr:hypothetical protein [Leptolyngbyaceae cyanobacterium CSU_1_4]
MNAISSENIHFCIKVAKILLHKPQYPIERACLTDDLQQNFGGAELQNENLVYLRRETASGGAIFRGWGKTSEFKIQN